MSRSQFINTISRHIIKRTNGLNHTYNRHFGINKRLLYPKPIDFNNEFYWLTNTDENYYAFGITPHFMEENGEPHMIFLEVDIDDVLMEGDIFAVLENEKAAISLEAPFDNAKLIELDESLDFDVINVDPENIENRICMFQDVNVDLKISNLIASGDTNNNVYNIPLL